MAGEPLLGWDSRALVAIESAFGTTPTPAGSQAIETVTLSLGPAEQGEVARAKKDRTRDLTGGGDDE